MATKGQFHQSFTGICASRFMLILLAHCIEQWFPNFSGALTTKNILVLLEAQNIDSY
jgi:hypothetical protein